MLIVYNKQLCEFLFCLENNIHVHKQFLTYIETVTYEGQTSRSKVNLPNQDTSLLRTVFLSPFTVLIRQVLLYLNDLRNS